MNLFKGFGIRVELIAKPDVADEKDRYKDSFHVVKETLTRIGIASERSKSLYQTAHILHKRGQYAILHFKEMFALDGKQTDITEEDINRRNVIANLLKEWGLLKVIDQFEVKQEVTHLRIISWIDKKNWKLQQKYSIGQKKKS